MGIKPRAIAVDGIGYKPYYIARFGIGSFQTEIIQDFECSELDFIRAIAVEGVGYDPFILATVGLGLCSFEIEVVQPVGGGDIGGTRSPEEPKPNTIIFRIKYKDKNIVKQYILKKKLSIRLLIKLLNIFHIPIKITMKAKELK